MTPRPHARRTNLPATTALAALALVAALAGCTGGGEDETHLTIDFSGMRASGDQVLEFDVPYDPDDRRTAPIYATNGGTHPDFHSALDQLDWALHSAGIPYEANWAEDFQTFFLASIDGVPGDASAYWSPSQDGEPSAVGLGDMELHAGDEVLLKLTRLADMGSDAEGGKDRAPEGAPELRVDAVPAPGTQASFRVEGTADPDAAVTATLDGRPVAVVRDGAAFSVEASIEPGHAALVLAAASDAGEAREVVPLVRLAQARLELTFTGAVPPRAAESHDVAYDVEEFASAPMYDGRDVAHPDFPNVHDLLEAWSAADGAEVVYGYFEGSGFSVDRIDGVGQPLTSAAPPYWCYKVNGESAGLGITLQPLAPGDVVAWDYGGCM